MGDNMNRAILANGYEKCNLAMIKFKGNPARFIKFYIYL